MMISNQQLGAVLRAQGPPRLLIKDARRLGPSRMTGLHYSVISISLRHFANIQESGSAKWNLNITARHSPSYITEINQLKSIYSYE